MANDQRWPMIAENPLPPSEDPVTVEDLEYTHNPTASREVLTNCLRSLAYKVKMSLDVDYDTNQRCARRLKLDNRTNDHDGREEFIVRLPLDANCWNDVDHETIELAMINTIIRLVESEDHIWYMMRASFDDYMDPLTRDFMEMLDRGEPLENFLRPRQPPPNKSGISPAPAPAPIPAPMPAPIPAPDLTAETPRAHPKNEQQQLVPKVAEVITISDDEDDIVTLE